MTPVPDEPEDQPPKIAEDKQLGVSIRFIRQWKPDLGPSPEEIAAMQQLRWTWRLTTLDRFFLEALHISAA